MNSRWACMLIMLPLVGCGTLNPHVTWKQSKWEGSTHSLPDAIDYADKAKNAYKKALGSQAQLRSWLGIGLIPLGAAATGIGIMGGTPGAITAIALTGAAGFGVGQWLESKPAQRAWVAGYNATSCSVDVMLPYTFVNGDDLKTEIDGISVEIGNLEFSTNDLAERTQQKDQSSGQADAAVKVARQAITHARSVTDKATGLRMEASIAGRRLKEAVDRIAGHVSSSLVETGPDIQDLSKLIAGLGQSYGQFVKVPTPAKAPALGTQPMLATRVVVPLQNEIESVLQGAAKLSANTEKLANLVNAMADKKPIETLKSCGVSEDKKVTPLSIDPPGKIDLTEGIRSSVVRTIKGGASPYGVTLFGQDLTGNIVVRQLVPFGPAFVVETTKNSTPTTAHIYATDGLGNSTLIDVEVTPKGK